MYFNSTIHGRWYNKNILTKVRYWHRVQWNLIIVNLVLWPILFTNERFLLLQDSMIFGFVTYNWYCMLESSASKWVFFIDLKRLIRMIWSSGTLWSRQLEWGRPQTKLTRFLCWHFLRYEHWQKMDIFGPPKYLPRLVNVDYEKTLKHYY